MPYDARLRLSDGRVLGYLDQGDRDGTPVFFLHGSPGSRLSAIDLAGQVAERGGRLVAPDRPGRGLSDPAVGRSLASWADDVAELADSLNLGPDPRRGECCLAWIRARASAAGPGVRAWADDFSRQLNKTAPQARLRRRIGPVDHRGGVSP